MKVESKVLFSSLLKDIENQQKKHSTLTAIEIANQFFSESHEIAIRFFRLHQSVTTGGFSKWYKEGLLQEDFEILYEYIEKGYSQHIHGFENLLTIFGLIKDMGNKDSFSFVRLEKITCPDCDGTGGTYVSGKCLTCSAFGIIQDEVIIEGKGEEAIHEFLNSLNESYLSIAEETRFSAFETFINSYDDEVNIEQALSNYEKKMKPKPFCKLIGEDGNVFNLLAVVSRTLKKHDLREQVDELSERVWGSKSYKEALSIMSEYVEIF